VRRSFHAVTSHREPKSRPGVPLIPLHSVYSICKKKKKKLSKCWEINIRYFGVNIVCLWIAGGNEGNSGGAGQGTSGWPKHVWE